MTSFASIAAKKRELDTLKSTLRPGSLDGLDHSQRIDITFTSNAIEGNTLTASETALVVEKGITCGKRLDHHVEAVDYYQTLEWIRDVAAQDAKGKKVRSITEPTIRTLNFMLLRRTRGEDHLTYINLPKGSSFYDQMTWQPPSVIELCTWLKMEISNPETAARAHNRLTALRPFAAANGPTSRLLLNYILLRGGYPPIAIQSHELDETGTVSETIVCKKLDATLDVYIKAARQFPG